MDPRPSARAELAPSRRAAAQRATDALAEAEALAALAVVSGPADAVPDEAGTAAWVADWERRARAALRRAWEWSTAPGRIARDRARRIAERIRSGARDVRRAVPDAARELGERVDAIGRAAGRIAGWGVLGALSVPAGATLAALGLAYAFLARK